MGTTPLITSLRLTRPTYSLQFFQLASPPRIHMDSWWAARNPNHGLKWTHNIAQNRSGAYGPEPCRIWASKLLELVFYLSWLNEPAEPAEPDSNWSNRWKKIMKILQNVPSRVRNSLKKTVHDSKFRRGRYDQNNYQKSVFYTGWLDEPAEPAEQDANRSNRLQKNLENLIECLWKSKESMKKSGVQFRVWMREL